MSAPTSVAPLRVAALFAGIGGLDVGLEEFGHETVLLSEWDGAAQAVLREHFPGVRIRGDVREIKSLPRVDMITGGFPCQDISFIGTRAGLSGTKSGMVWEMFRLIARHKPQLVLMENVSNLLRLQRGEAMQAVLRELENCGYRWAYRLVDTRGFGLPQRRLRVVILASRGDVDPSDILFSRSVEPKFDDAIVEPDTHSLYGFYWTEGSRGVGWAKDAVPTIKGGSGLGIPSPPAIYNPRTGIAGTLSLTDAERLQGFPVGWTEVNFNSRPMKAGERWKMLGNAVSAPLSKWIGEELSQPSSVGSLVPAVRFTDGPFPSAGRGSRGRWERVVSTTHVLTSEHVPLGSFLRDEPKPLSAKALSGYIKRVEGGRKNLPKSFVRALKAQLKATT